jgi:hypothetical protein
MITWQGTPRPNLQFDILPDGDFRHDCRRFALRAAPLPAVVVRFVRALRTTCSRGSGPPVDQRGQVFTWAVMDPQDRHRDRPRRQSSTSRATTSLPKPSDGRYPDRRRTRLHPSDRQLGHLKDQLKPIRHRIPRRIGAGSGSADPLEQLCLGTGCACKFARTARHGRGGGVPPRREPADRFAVPTLASPTEVR